jgi:hypothetical protein
METVPVQAVGIFMRMTSHGGFRFGKQTISVSIVEEGGKQICWLVEPGTPCTVTLPETG